MVNLSKVKNVYMIGIKGVGMTMLAQFLAEKGYNVSGSDTPEVFMTDEVLKKSNIKISENFNPDNIPPDTDLIVFSTAYNEKTNSELNYAKTSNPKILFSYAEVLAEIFNNYYGIAVTGTHGKTTTSAWLGYVMDKSGLSPSVMVGAQVKQLGGNTMVGTSDYLVIEADEYQNKLQYYYPKALLLNNIDFDHPDFFKSKSDYKNVFVDFVKKIPKKGFLVANFDDAQVRSVSESSLCRIVSYAINEAADYVAYNIKLNNGKQYFNVKFGVDEDSGDLGEFSISLSGKHNIYNALAVIATSIELNISLSNIRTHLEDFTGAARRMEIMGKFRGALIIDDYAHHPTEVKSTISGVREFYQDKRLVVVFHPHTFTRTKELIDDFAHSFDEVDELIVLDIYGSVRENHGGVHSLDLLDKIKKHNANLKTNYLPTLSDVENYLRDNISSRDLILLMGAGDIFRVGQNLIK